MVEQKIILVQPKKVTIVESIVDQIVQLVQSGELKAGDKLPSERQLIAMLGVGRSSVREALQGLVMMNLVETRPGHGSYVRSNLAWRGPNLSVANLSNDLLRDMRLKLIDARCLVESNIAFTAATSATDDYIARLRGAFEDYVRYIVNFADPRYLAAHNSFHILLAQMTGNPFLVPAIDNLIRAIPQTLREREFTFPKEIDLQILRQEQIEIHRDILIAVANRNPEGAKEAMVAHMHYERDLVLRVYQQDDSA